MSMFNSNEDSFIREMAKDYISARNLLNVQPHEPVIEFPNIAPVFDNPLRKIGRTDYGKYDNIVNELNREDATTEQNGTTAHNGCSGNHEGRHSSSCGSSCSHDHSKERSIYEKPYHEKMEAVRLFREEGNDGFKNKNFHDAIAAYKRAIVYLDYTIGETDQENDEADKERCKCYLNLAACTLEVEDLSSAINYCRLAIQLDSENSKGYYRRGMAYLRKGDLNEAQNDFYKAMKLTANEPPESRRSVESAIRELNVRWREYRKKASLMAKAAIA